jgi:hypothetical protein
MRKTRGRFLDRERLARFSPSGGAELRKLNRYAEN